MKLTKIGQNILFLLFSHSLIIGDADCLEQLKQNASRFKKIVVASKFIFGSNVYNLAKVYVHQNILWVVVHVIIIDQ